MAANFQIYSFKTSESLHLKLTGDFDGSSANELIKTLITNGTGFWNIFIDTDNLKTIHPINRDMFQKNLKISKKQLNNVIFIGINKNMFTANWK